MDNYLDLPELKIFDRLEVVSRNGRQLQDEFTLCDGRRHYLVVVLGRAGESLQVIFHSQFCDRACLEAETIEPNKLPQKVRDILMVRVPAGHVAVEMVYRSTPKVHAQGADVRLCDLRHAVLLEPGQHIGIPERDPLAREVMSLVYNHQGRPVIETHLEDPDKRASIQKKIELMKMGLAPQKAFKAVRALESQSAQAT